MFGLLRLLPVVVSAIVVEVVTSSAQLSGSLSSGGLAGPDLNPWQGVLSRGQVEWRMHALDEAE